MPVKNLVFFNTNQVFTEKIPGKPRVLVAPLDWGLGHATRCIPVIKELIIQGCEVILAGEGACAELLQTEFPELPILNLAGYNVRYHRSGRNLSIVIIRQLAKIRKAIAREHQWLKKAVEEYNIDAVISDNRFGLYHDQAPSVFITHQLSIKSPFGKWSEKLVQQWNYKYINRFTECWVPDFEDKDNNLAGKLSHPDKNPKIPLKYTGPLSRFKDSGPGVENQLLILLSGPEPQRSIFENKLVDELAHYNGTAAVVRGLPATSTVIPSSNQIRFYNHLPSAELNIRMQEASMVISRSGYSTVMDLVQLQKKSVLVPTMGQTEQEYLARYLEEKGIACALSQTDFSLLKAIKKADEFKYHLPSVNIGADLKTIIKTFISKLELKRSEQVSEL
jgi:uncharacterized protein (TIGR00661 family)